ncbi:hypothetical protein KVT40_007813 [Elsinoe batatas]|uniref:Uncharacterized protein n=1 Tax=Elsinoe batatas TaxID=2601811 RepID=A0A8K0KVD8_9PEZI|nr:hypothetical protein KVT40_007813 [Elsinoe batatas]
MRRRSQNCYTMSDTCFPSSSLRGTTRRTRSLLIGRPPSLSSVASQARVRTRKTSRTRSRPRPPTPTFLQVFLSLPLLAPPPANSLYQFNGHACLDWILDNCMVTSEQEALAIANLFLRHGLISAEQEKEDFELGTLSGFSARTSAMYRITDRGLDSTIWELSPRQSMDTSRSTHSREAQSNSDKLLFILEDPALRLVFREFLDLRQCEENLTFYYEVKEVMETWASIKSAPEAQMETVIAAVHSLYNAFLVDNAVSEVNLGSRLRKDLQASVCDLFQTPDEKATLLRATLDLFLAAQDSIFGLMASDCVPLFLQQQGNDRLYMDRSVQRGITLQAH